MKVNGQRQTIVPFFGLWHLFGVAMHASSQIKSIFAHNLLLKVAMQIKSLLELQKKSNIL